MYIDDIIVLSKTFDNHLRDVGLVLDRIIHSNMQLKASKCHFFQRNLINLGHLISVEGVGPDPAKIKAIVGMRTPINIAEVRAFFGKAGYNRMYVKNFSLTCEPLYHLTRKDVIFKWTDKEQKAFDDIKSFFINAPLVSHPNLDHQFIINTDACDAGLGAALLQKYDDKIHVIQYISCTLGEDERKWHTRQKEALAIVWACEMFRVYVAGTHFIVESDHSSLEWLRKVHKPQRLVR